MCGDLFQQPQETRAAGWKRAGQRVLRGEGSRCPSLYCSPKLLQQKVTFFIPPWDAKRD